jgi:hypothetical protein
MLRNVVTGTVGVVTAGTLAVGVLVGIPTAVYFGVFKTAHVRGTVNLSNQNQDATNRISAEGTWNIANADVLTDEANIKLDKKLYAAADPQGFIATAETACNKDVTSFNSFQSEPLMKDWKPATVPLSYSLSVCN